jgi:hypothetical protein
LLSALSAEALKMRTHKATWFLVWLYPILFTILFLIAIGVGLSGIDQTPSRQSLADWLEDAAIVWNVPPNSLGRYLIAAFVAVVFAGEYGWNTWKLIVPHRARSSLVAAKYSLILILFAVSFIVTAMICTLGTWAEDVASGDAIPAGITVAALLGEHGRGALAALAPLFVTIAYASLAAVLTRSTIAALVISIVIVTIEQIIANLAPMLSVYSPTIVEFLYRVLPGYHIGNRDNWIDEGAALRGELFGGRIVELGWATSLAVVAAWVVGLVAVTFAAFKRQDIN